MRRGIDGIGYSKSKEKWFIYDVSIDYDSEPTHRFLKPMREDSHTIYYDTFEDASIQLGIIQEKYKGSL